MPTHEVFNQAPPLAPYNVFSENTPLVEALHREGAGWAEERVTAMGATAGDEGIEWGRLANEHPPVLRTHDRYGNRIDEVEFHPAWHKLLGMSVAHAVHSLPWSEPQPGAHVARAAMMIGASESDSGVGCPISMTYAAVPALRVQEDLAAEWVPRLISTKYDPRLVAASEKPGALCGMAMTEKQGGSDVRGEQHSGRSDQRWGTGRRVLVDRAQVVLLRPDV